MQRKLSLSFLLIGLFVVLLYDRDWGVNVLLLQIVYLIGLSWGQWRKFNRGHWALFSASLFSVLTAFIYHSGYALMISLVSLSVYSVALSYSEFRSIHLVFLSWLRSFFYSYIRWVRSAWSALPKVPGVTPRSGRVLIYSLTLPVIAIFLILYSAANPSFRELMANVFVGFGDAWSFLVSMVNFTVIFYLIWGVVCVVPLLYTTMYKPWIEKDRANQLELRRSPREKQMGFSRGLHRDLLQETRFGEVLLVILNIVLAVLLVLEVKDVWFGFSWEGQMLKEFVHEGIGILILSIFLSAGIAFYFFREHQNFFSKAKRLKQLTYIWLGLNGVLTISAFIRTLYYIEFFALAYRRIALIFFLVAVFIGLGTIAFKIYKKRNAHFMWQFNSWSVFAILILMCGINWDVWITKYNIEHRKEAFIEFSYLKTMNNKALPFMLLDREEWERARAIHRDVLGMDDEEFNRYYHTPASFIAHIEKRKGTFFTDWENKDILEWNPAEYLAYQRMKNQVQHTESK